ncbi:MAG: pseudouridine synthase, partial [Clostridia bacterium]|nr:pseudouridine synthase [Clostridia bacterium]
RVDGKRLMELARKGIEIERQAREIEIFAIKGKALTDTLYEIDVHCSKGTFIRTVCADIGKALGCGALMDKLIRTEAAGFKIEEAHKLSDLEKMSENERQSLILPLTETLFKGLPHFSYPPFYEALAKNGAAILTKKLPACDFETGQRVLLYDSEGFFALGEIKDSEDGQVLAPIKKFRL